MSTVRGQTAGNTGRRSAGSNQVPFLDGPGSIMLIVLSLGALIGVTAWLTQPQPIDEVARPAVQASQSGAAPAGGPSDRSAGSELPTSATILDVHRAGTALFSQGDLQGARARFESAIEQQPDDAEALNNLGLVLERLSQPEEAADRFSRAAGLRPEKWAYRFNYAHALGLLGQWERAVPEYRHAASLFPDDYATQYNLAMALHKSGDERAAAPEYERAIALAPGEPSFHLAYGTTLEALGQTEDARREYRAYLAMAPSAPDAEAVRSHLEEPAE
jgi:Flp pilus assembly protein TadD